MAKRAPGPITQARDAELEAGSDAHYRDIGYYRHTYADRTADVDYYVELASEVGGPVLEYGCGSGRITLPLARVGLSVTGVDRSEPMLGELERVLGEEPAALRRRVTWVCGDMREVELDEHAFSLVLCTFNTFLHLYTRREVEQFLAKVRRHLSPDGLFVLDASMPDPEELHRDPNRLHRTPRFRHATTGEVVRYGERFTYDPLRQVLIVGMEFEPRGRPEDSWVTPLTHRQFFPCEMEALLHYNGFALTDLHADFRREGPTDEVVDLIYHCRRRAADPPQGTR
ncbi:MAG: class I SAM-dependent methyltransferase [Myxococcota bacterium]